MKVEEFFSEGIKLAKPEYWTIFFNYIIFILLIILASVTIIGLLVVPALMMGFIQFILRAGRGEKVDVGDSLSWGFQDGMWLNSLIFSFIAGLGITIGFLLLVVPGIYLSVAWFLGVYLLVDKGLKPMEALEKSRELVHEVGFWKVLIILLAMNMGVYIIALVIPFFGSLALLFLYPFVWMVQVAIYQRAIKGDTKLIDADFQED